MPVPSEALCVVCHEGIYRYTYGWLHDNADRDSGTCRHTPMPMSPSERLLFEQKVEATLRDVVIRRCPTCGGLCWPDKCWNE